MQKIMKNKGITLVALVVSIIIMLILAGVTLNIALGENGLFKMTQEAVKKYDEKAKEEDNTLKDIEEQLGGYVSDRNMLKVGDEVNYNPKTEKTTYILDGNKSGYGEYSSDSYPYKLLKSINQTINQEEYTWKIMDINSKNGEVKIIGIPTENMSKVLFEGALGYNNGVYLLDEMCKELYSNNELGVIARSIDLEDIEGEMNDKGKKAKEDYINEYAIKKEFKGDNAYYPELYKYQKESNIDGIENTNGISESNDGTKTEAGIPMDYSTNKEGYEKAESIIVKNTGYMEFNPTKEYYDNEQFFNLIFDASTEYWIALRGCYSQSYVVDFGLHTVYNGKITPRYLFGSNGGNDYRVFRICPVVTLGSNIKITKKVNESTWNLSK